MNSALKTVCGCVLAVCGLSQVFGAEGHIQIKCEPDLQILLDGEQKGVSTATGLILHRVPAGPHVLLATKPDVQPQQFGVLVTGGQVLLVRLEACQPAIRIRLGGVKAAQTGTLIISSLPMECTVDCKTLDLKQLRKTNNRMFIEDVPAGSHTLVFTAADKSLKLDVRIDDGKTQEVLADFVGSAVSEIPSAFVQLAPGQKPQRGWLGAQIVEVTPAERKKMNLADDAGVMIEGVYPKGPANTAGLRVRDVVLAVGGKDVHKPRELLDLIGEYPPGSQAELDILRSGENKTLTITIGTPPKDFPETRKQE